MIGLYRYSSFGIVQLRSLRILGGAKKFHDKRKKYFLEQSKNYIFTAEIPAYIMKKNEIRVTNVPEGLHKELKNIAYNHGVTLTHFLKPKLREIAESYPERMKVKDGSKEP